MSKRSRIRRFGLLLSLILLAPTGSGQATLGDGSLEAFVDGVAYATMKRNKIAGVTVAITRGNHVMLQKGYGYADVGAKTPVDPATTLFRIGSVTKLFTWTALMQLRDAGKIDFNTDVNQYLETLEMPDTFPEPITVRHLMTHSGGIEDRVVGLFGNEPAVMKPYAEILDAELPSRVRPPGEVSSYSNHGVGVAGLLIEDVSGMSWNDYIDVNILKPLGMTAATGRQPVPDALLPDLSRSYAYEAGKFVEKPFEFVPLGAVGGMSASALAMTRFARAHLNGGELDGVRILSESSTLQMRQPLFEQHEEINPWLYGFANYSRGGTFIYGHSGGTLRFFTEFALIPEDNVSIFVSTNTTNGFRVQSAVFQGFLDRYYPKDDKEPETTALTNPEEFVGQWATYRHPVTTPDKLLRAAQPISVQATSKDEIMIVGLGEHPTYWRQIARHVFRNTESGTKLAFDTGVEPKRMMVGSVLFSFYKIRELESTRVQIPLLAISLVLFLWALIAWPVQRSRRDGTLSVALGRARVAGWLQALTVFVVIGMLLTVSEEIVFGLSATLSIVLWMSLLIPFLALAQLLLAAPVWTSDAHWTVKTFHSVLVVAALLISWLLYYWNLLGPYRW